MLYSSAMRVIYDPIHENTAVNTVRTFPHS